MDGSVANTALTIAAYYGHAAVLLVLLAFGTDPTALPASDVAAAAALLAHQHGEKLGSGAWSLPPIVWWLPQRHARFGHVDRAAALALLSIAGRAPLLLPRAICLAVLHFTTFGWFLPTPPQQPPPTAPMAPTTQQLQLQLPHGQPQQHYAWLEPFRAALDSTGSARGAATRRGPRQ